MIRIHFGADDARRVSFVTEPDPLQDAALAARALRCDLVPPSARRWGRQARTRVHAGMRPLFALVGPRGFPDFLTPELDNLDLDAATAVLRDTPSEVIRAELEPFGTEDPWVRELVGGRTRARRDLAEAVRSFHDAALRPWATATSLRLGADLAERTRALLHGGVDELLNALHPDVVWSAPILTTYAAKPAGPTLDVRLGGRGLRLYPSALISHCVMTDVPGRTPVLCYPLLPVPYDEDAEHVDHLADLLGRTRATVLRTLSVSGSTSQLARRAGIAPASASEHTRVLRNAGMVVTDRRGGGTLHSLTPLGRRLLTDPAVAASGLPPSSARFLANG